VHVCARVHTHTHTRARTQAHVRAPSRTAAGRATSQRINNRDLAHPRVRRSNELAAASEMHPFCRRCAAARVGKGEAEGAGGRGRRAARPPRDAVARTRRRARSRFFGAGLFAQDCSAVGGVGRGKGLRAKIYTVCVSRSPWVFSSFARCKRTVVVADARLRRHDHRQIDIADNRFRANEDAVRIFLFPLAIESRLRRLQPSFDPPSFSVCFRLNEMMGDDRRNNIPLRSDAPDIVPGRAITQRNARTRINWRRAVAKPPAGDARPHYYFFR